MGQLTHWDERGASRMVDVAAKPETARMARASAEVQMAPSTLTAIQDLALRKGNVWEVARLAGIQAAKQTPQLIPLCHVIPLTGVTIDFHIPNLTEPPAPPGHASLAVVRIEAVVRCVARTGVEMEALTAASVAALTVYDMCKSIDRRMTIRAIRLEEKEGGKSGHFVHDANG